MQDKKEISQKIINYAIWYYLKYFPSINKIKQKLREKFGPESEKGKKYGGIFEDDIEYIINEKMGNILVEKQIITSTINSYINKGKNLFYIKSKLYEKGFKKEEFENILEEEFDIENTSILNYEKIYKQVQVLFKKNKSRNFIRNKYVENSFDGEIVDSILDEIFIDGEQELLNNELEKILRKSKIISWSTKGFSSLQTSELNYSEKQKIIQKLLSKGFGYSEIKSVMGI